jgi:hypothetical protein
MAFPGRGDIPSEFHEEKRNFTGWASTRFIFIVGGQAQRLQIQTLSAVSYG